MLPLVIKAKNIILDIFFPPLCLNCGKYLDAGNEGNRSEFLCSDCHLKIKINGSLFCPICRARVPDNKKICHFDSPYLLAAAGNYDDPVLQNLIHYFKYKSFASVAPILGEIIVEYIENCKLKIENFVVVPIPLHPRRERKRGFNQAKLLAQNLSWIFDLEVIDGLSRIKNNKPQVNLKDYEERLKNINGCFEIKNPGLLSGRNILLIDDVFTSGATMNEAAKALKQAGAKKIIALVLARA